MSTYANIRYKMVWTVIIKLYQIIPNVHLKVMHGEKKFTHDRTPHFARKATEQNSEGIFEHLNNPGIGKAQAGLGIANEI